MKLADLLARELESWPEDCKYIVQDTDRWIGSYYAKPVFDGSVWRGGDSYIGQPIERDFDHELASDHSTALITREIWQSARDKLKGETKVSKPKGNKDGWIRHRGGKCPVAEGLRVEYRMRDGSVMDSTAGSLEWGHFDECGDIMAYRIHAPAQSAESMTVLDATTAFDMLDNPGEPNEALKSIIAIDAPMPDAKYFDGPLQWRDRIKEIDTTVVDLEDERASLIQRLADEGLALLRVDGKPMPKEPIKAEDSAHGDMGDWRNWLPGDLVECVHTKDAYPAVLTIGKLYTVRNHEGAVEDDDGDQMMYCTRANCFKWHSRP